MRIRCESLSCSFDSLRVFEGLDMEFPERHVTAVLGPSGCGKTTLLNLISGVIRPDGGRVVVDRAGQEPGTGAGPASGRPASGGLESAGGPESGGLDSGGAAARAAGRSGAERGGRIGYLFQEPRLLPWKTVRRNVELVLEQVYGRARRSKIAEEFLGAVGLGEFLDYYPYALSGGMRQRVAIARAFAYPAELMLLDEPFQALDLRLKLSLSTLFIRLWGRDPRTTIFVTHDIQEALILGDRIVVLSDRPARPVGEFENPVEAGRRELSDRRLNELERRLYGLLAG